MTHKIRDDLYKIVYWDKDELSPSICPGAYAG